jgi:prepilin-type N-terminal cleavage/methylation domain-containing protein
MIGGYKKRGFTLIELLIVIALIIVIFIILLINLRTQLNKTNDSRRKTDLYKIQKALEEYYNDAQCYPTQGIIDTCGGKTLSPYLVTIPCDPVKKTPYVYEPGAPTACFGYRACAKLENLADPDITRIGCDPVIGCGGTPGYNYCVSVGIAPSTLTGGEGNTGNGDGGPTWAASPTPTPEPGNYACSPGGGCNNYADPSQAGCPVTYKFAGCVYMGIYQCQYEENRCTIY